MTFEDYQNKYENLKLERTNSGILTITMHTNGGSHLHTGKAHREFAEILTGQSESGRMLAVWISDATGTQTLVQLQPVEPLSLSSLGKTVVIASSDRGRRQLSPLSSTGANS